MKQLKWRNAYHILCHQPIFKSFERRLQISLLKYIVTCNAEHKNTNIAITWDVCRVPNYKRKLRSRLSLLECKTLKENKIVMCVMTQENVRNERKYITRSERLTMPSNIYPVSWLTCLYSDLICHSTIAFFFNVFFGIRWHCNRYVCIESFKCTN